MRGTFGEVGVLLLEFEDDLIQWGLNKYHYGVKDYLTISSSFEIFLSAIAVELTYRRGYMHMRT